jgi:hypothetical protein
MAYGDETPATCPKCGARTMHFESADGRQKWSMHLRPADGGLCQNSGKVK